MTRRPSSGLISEGIGRRRGGSSARTRERPKSAAQKRSVDLNNIDLGIAHQRAAEWREGRVETLILGRCGVAVNGVGFSTPLLNGGGVRRWWVPESVLRPTTSLGAVLIWA